MSTVTDADLSLFPGAPAPLRPPAATVRGEAREPESGPSVREADSDDSARAEHRCPPLIGPEGSRWVRSRAGILCLEFGRGQHLRYEENWTPVRFVRQSHVCHLCWNTIVPGSPGKRVGERGTKAYYEPNLNLWECLQCGSQRS